MRKRRTRSCAQVNEVCPHDVEHGKPGTYVHHGCRCEPCVLAKRAYERGAYARRRLRVKRGKVELEHGTYKAYAVWGCRCRPCRLAGGNYHREGRYRRGEQG